MRSTHHDPWPARRSALLARLRQQVLAEGGRLIVTLDEPGPRGNAPALLEHSGFTVLGVAWADA